MKKHIEHVRHHAHKHHENHLRLKDLLGLPLKKEKIWSTFLVTFFMTLISITIYMNWGKVIDFLTPEPPKELPMVHGYQTGALGAKQIEKQASSEHKIHLTNIPSSGHLTGIKTSQAVGKKDEEKIEWSKSALKNTIWITNMLSHGQHLTKLKHSQTQALQKSILTTFYLGEKTISINSTLTSDTKILQKINNVLSVDIFYYLNQSANRADTLENHIKLLEILQKKCNERINDLGSKITFLKGNSESKEIEIKTSEETFFENLKLLNGESAENELGKFIGAEEKQVGIKAKIGAYTKLQEYYKFFMPRLETLTRTIKLNRGPLIAGVKVVEIQNMALPLIIQQK